RLKRNIEIYYEEAEKNGWPDRLNRGRWKFGWDAEKHRGFGCCRYVHILRPGHEREDLQRYKEPIELQWDYYGPFGFAAVLSDLGEPMYDLNMKVTADLIMQIEIAIVGTADEVIDKIMRIKERGGYDDFMFTAWFEAGGRRGRNPPVSSCRSAGWRGSQDRRWIIGPEDEEGGHEMPQYLYQVAYTSESLAAQIKNPQDRLEVVGKQLNDAVGARILAGGYSYGEYDISVIVDAPDDVTMAAVAVAIAAGGAVRPAKPP